MTEVININARSWDGNEWTALTSDDVAAPIFSVADIAVFLGDVDQLALFSIGDVAVLREQAAAAMRAVS